jgi:hypothetical protein
MTFAHTHRTVVEDGRCPFLDALEHGTFRSSENRFHGMYPRQSTVEHAAP